MSIVKMRKLRLIGLNKERDRMIRALAGVGCVEFADSAALLEDPEYAALLSPAGEKHDRLREDCQLFSGALEILGKYASVKTGLFYKPIPVTEEELRSPALLRQGREIALRLREGEAEILRLRAEESRLRAQLQSLTPWKDCSLPLSFAGTRETRACFGTLPASQPLPPVETALAAEAEEAELMLVSKDRDASYLLLVAHRAVSEEALSLVKRFGFVRTDFSEEEGTAGDHIAAIEKELASLGDVIARVTEAMEAYGPKRDELRKCCDAADQLLAEAQTVDRLAVSGSIFAADAWYPVPAEEKLTQVLESFTCAWEAADPTAEDDVPVLLENNRITRPLNMVTEMYSYPAYAGVDPNPLIMPFFTVFFGIMYADMGYGLVLLILGLLSKKFIKKSGSWDYVKGLLIECGITTILFGFLFGGFFGDAIPTVTTMLGLPRIDLWAAVNPMKEPMTLLIASVIIGAVQILCGMAVKAWMCIRDGRWKDALMDVGSWWLLFAGIALGALGVTWLVALAGVLALVLTQGRAKPTVVGKLVGGLASLYDVTSFLSDILSYTRLMALMLATTVIASVVNMLGSMVGPILFLPIFLIGHVFNMGINIIGTFVHAARLQYLEFYNRFYIDGGRKFNPLRFNTNYAQIVKGGN